MFTFHRLSPGLWFELLVAGTGYEPQLTDHVVPGSDTQVAATLVRRHIVNDPTRVYRGRIVNTTGLALRDAVIQPIGALLDAKTGAASYGLIPGLDPIAVTDDDGNFEVAYSQPSDADPMSHGTPVKLLVSIDARGMAEATTILPAGLPRSPITVMDGATVRGRLIQNGNPVGNAEIGIFGYPRGDYGQGLNVFGSPYGEIKVGTQPDGTFAIPNVPIPGNWYVYAKMDSVAKRGATGTIKCATKVSGETVDMGSIELKPAYHFRGKVMLSDDKPIPDGMRVTISSETAFDSQTTTLASDGHFAFVGIAAGSYDVFASVRGYLAPPPAPVSMKMKHGHTYTYTPPPPPVPIEHDVDNFLITLHPKASPAAKAAPSAKR